MKNEKPLLEVVIANDDEINELISDPKVYGEALSFLINELRKTRDTSDNLTWEGEDFTVKFLT